MNSNCPPPFHICGIIFLVIKQLRIGREGFIQPGFEGMVVGYA